MNSFIGKIIKILADTLKINGFTTKLKLMKFSFFLSMLFCIILFTTGCTTYKNIPYFKDLPDSIQLDVLKAPYKDLVIQPDDILSINIQTIDPGANAVFSQASPTSYLSAGSTGSGASTSNGSTYPGTAMGGYLVNKSGDVEVPLLGTFHVAGLTSLGAQDSILARAILYYKNPVINVRFANFKITVLGEVTRPGAYIIPNERATIFDALGFAGDLTIFGKRENVLLIRDSAQQSRLIRLNLNSKDIVKSEYFYLRQNDVVYVEPIKAKIANLDASQNKNYAIMSAVLSVIIIAATRIK